MACVTWLLSNMEYFVPLQQSKMQIAFATKSIVEECFGGQTFLGQQLLLINSRAAHRENRRQEQEAAILQVSHPVPTRFIVSAAANTGTHYGGASFLCHCLPEAMAENKPHTGARDK